MSTTLTSAVLPIEEFRTKLEEAVDARGASYQSIKVLIFRFEDDATGADQDANTFSSCMQDVFGIDDVEDFVIGKTFQISWTYFGERKSEDALERTFHEYILAPTYDLIQNLDVLAVLDCCYAGSAVRAGANRSVQLLAGCDERHTVRPRQDGVTFTQRFRQAAWALKRAGNFSVSVESLFGELQRVKPPKAPEAVHRIIGNARPLVLALKRRSSSREVISSSNESSSPPGEVISSSNQTNVLFKISLAGGPTGMILSEFLQLTKAIPPEFTITVEDAFESNSVVFLCRASWEAFARLRSTLDCAFIASVKGPSLVHGMMR
ncbi:hypothetical protein V1506DRAFT_561530 [Lipomyces tetrasporus]